MKNRLLCVLFLSLVSTLSWAQIKIGENPQSLDVFSVLELESTSRALVITRVNTAQMENMTPLRGALVYNTETQCIHFYDGVNWINPCDQPDEQTFSAEAIVNANPTIIITEDPATSNFNFEVGKINGIESIVPSTVNGDLHIQQRSITTNQLADDSVTLDKLVNGTVPGQLLRWNGTNWELLDESALSVTELDGVIGNEVTNAADATLIRTGAGTDADPFVLDVNTNGIGTNELDDLAVTNAKINDDAITTDKILDNDVTTDDLANASVTTIKIDDDAVTPAKLADGTAAGQLLQWDGADWQLVDDSALTITEQDAIVGNEVTNATDGTLTLNGLGNLANPYTLDVSAGGIDTNELANDAVTNIKLANDAVTPSKLADGTAAGQLLQWDGVDWQLVDDSALTITEQDAIVGNEVTDAADATLIRTGTGNNADPFVLDVNANGIGTNELANDAVTPAKLANGTAAGQLLQWDGADWQLVDDSALTITEQDAIVGNEVTDAADATLIRTGTGNNADPFVLDVNANGIGTNELANDAVTPSKLADGTAAGQLLQWDGADWQLVDDSALTITEQDAIVGNEVTDAADATLIRTGTGNNADPFVLDVNANGIGTNELANDAVTPAKLANGTTAGQLLEWNGTDWALVQNPIALSAIVPAASNNGTTGAYTIMDPAVQATSIIQLTVQENAPGNPVLIQLTDQMAGEFSVQIYEITGTGFNQIDAIWHYTVVNP